MVWPMWLETPHFHQSSRVADDDLFSTAVCGQTRSATFRVFLLPIQTWASSTGDTASWYSSSSLQELALKAGVALVLLIVVNGRHILTMRVHVNRGSILHVKPTASRPRGVVSFSLGFTAQTCSSTQPWSDARFLVA